ncbi:MAG: phage baseplate assembly protein V [Candidatus Thorarchaeota archaeon]
MDRGVTNRLYGNYRAKVVENKDREQFGRVLVWIPDLMPDLDDNKGIWARPANNPIGGRNTQYENDNHYMGTCYIPRKGSWVWVFFEAGNINRPYYFAGLDIEQAKVLPENQVGSNYQDKWTIFKSHDGRTILISDDPDDARVEITGKKRKLTTPPSGDRASVYEIDNNQTTILFDERTGKQKILIRTYKGDFLHIDIDERKLQAEFESDILLKTNGKFQLLANEDIDLKSKVGDVHIEAESGNMDIKSADSMKARTDADMNLSAQGDLKYSSSANINGQAGGNMNHDAGGNLNEQVGASTQATQANGATDAEPKGERNT